MIVEPWVIAFFIGFLLFVGIVVVVINLDKIFPKKIEQDESNGE